MTIAALLRHHGVNVPRWVTIDGQIVFDNVTTTPANSSHPAHGTVTPVANHTFHGGENPPADKGTETSPWWNDAPRFNRHRAAMDKSFPGWVYLAATDDEAPSWGGTIDTGRGKFLVAIYPRRDEGLPRITVLGPKLGVNAGRRWIPSPHLYLNGTLCVAAAEDWNPREHTVATAASWAAHWLAAYTEWRMTRRWPVEGSQGIAV
ncbi:hypothetical protein [Arthrobacter globiformis]|uniref:Type II CBASS E2 protein domain-containing protein n=1 Tax=Arthrobacter globiformis TaxID=1665 RepID=A0A328HFE9_ARTGO|nr:hypothetical protein [Arthrobacter globiformis]RAM37349.1 hypothetical protein DBZ45_11105 [Arthrobacter globiformis]